MIFGALSGQVPGRLVQGVDQNHATTTKPKTLPPNRPGGRHRRAVGRMGEGCCPSLLLNPRKEKHSQSAFPGLISPCHHLCSWVPKNGHSRGVRLVPCPAPGSRGCLGQANPLS